jgi:hypothetical protein
MCEKAYFKNRYSAKKQQISAQKKAKYYDDSKPTKERVKLWRIANPDRVKVNRLKEQECRKTPERRAILALRAANWRSKNPDKVRQSRAKQKGRLEVRLADNLRGRLNSALKNNQKKGSAIRDLGCSIVELKHYLAARFYPNLQTAEQMTWENYGFRGWHIDHIIPLSSFNLTNSEQLIKACHYTNLQPLWAKDNLRKSDKIIK